MKTTIIFTPVDIEARKALDFSSGDVVRVWNKIKEADGKTRLQAFEGMVLARKHGTEIGATFTVRRVASGVGVERVYPLFGGMSDKIELVIRHSVMCVVSLRKILVLLRREVQQQPKLLSKKLQKKLQHKMLKIKSATKRILFFIVFMVVSYIPQGD